MSEFKLPVLGFGDRPRLTTIKWKDGTPLGILSLAPDPEFEARHRRKQQIQRSANVIDLAVIDKKARLGGRGFGELDNTDLEFLRPDFDRKRQVGVKAVGMFATADKPGVAPTNAQLEGGDVE